MLPLEILLIGTCTSLQARIEQSSGYVGYFQATPLSEERRSQDTSKASTDTYGTYPPTWMEHIQLLPDDKVRDICQVFHIPLASAVFIDQDTERYLLTLRYQASK